MKKVVCDWIILSYTTFLEYLPIFLHLQVCGISLTRFKEFRRFWPCSFVDPLVKVTDKFWKIRGLIDGFNESRRQISSGREKPQMSQWVPYNYVPPLKEIYCTTHIYLGSRSHWGPRWRMWHAQGWGWYYTYTSKRGRRTWRSQNLKNIRGTTVCTKRLRYCYLRVRPTNIKWHLLFW